MFSIKKASKRSGNFARDRVGKILLSERLDCSPQLLQMIKQDLLHTLKKYARIEDASARLRFEKEAGLLHFEVPLKKEHSGIQRDFRI